MVLHGSWDFPVFAVGTAHLPRWPAVGVLGLAVGVLALDTVWFTFRNVNDTPLGERRLAGG